MPQPSLKAHKAAGFRAFSLGAGPFLAFFVRKLRDLLVTLLLLSFLVFFLFSVIPGDPVTLILGTHASPDRRAALEEELGLDQPPLSRYAHSVWGLFSDEQPVRSIRFQKPVLDLIGPRLALTLRLSLFAFILILLLAIPLALLSAHYAGSALDRFFSYWAEIHMAIPAFFLGLLLILLFVFALGLPDLNRYVPREAGLFQHLYSLFLPALALALPRVGQAQQFYRTALLQTKEEAYVLTAKAKGASPSYILFFHMMRNSLLPLVTSLGLIFAEILTGSLVIEQVFVLPGAGRLLFSAISSRDFPLAQALILALAGLVVVVNVLVDLINALIDPRLTEALGEADEVSDLRLAQSLAEEDQLQENAGARGQDPGKGGQA